MDKIGTKIEMYVTFPLQIWPTQYRLTWKSEDCPFNDSDMHIVHRTVKLKHSCDNYCTLSHTNQCKNKHTLSHSEYTQLRFRISAWFLRVWTVSTFLPIVTPSRPPIISRSLTVWPFSRSWRGAMDKKRQRTTWTFVPLHLFCSLYPSLSPAAQSFHYLSLSVFCNGHYFWFPFGFNVRA